MSTIPMVCPQCKASLRGKEIPAPDREAFGGETNFSRAVGIYSLKADTTVGWKCPDCDHEWERTEKLPRGYRTYELISRP